MFTAVHCKLCHHHQSVVTENVREQRPSDAVSRSASQDIVRPFWNLKIHYRMHPWCRQKCVQNF